MFLIFLYQVLHSARRCFPKPNEGGASLSPSTCIYTTFLQLHYTVLCLESVFFLLWCHEDSTSCLPTSSTIATCGLFKSPLYLCGPGDAIPSSAQDGYLLAVCPTLWKNPSAQWPFFWSTDLNISVSLFCALLLKTFPIGKHFSSSGTLKSIMSRSIALGSCFHAVSDAPYPWKQLPARTS